MTQAYILMGFIVSIVAGAGVGAYALQLYTTTQITCAVPQVDASHWPPSMFEKQPVPPTFKSY